MRQKPIRVVYPDGLTAREHAIVQAHQWQKAHAAENMPTPSEAYTIIAHLLALLPYKELLGAIAKADPPAPSRRPEQMSPKRQLGPKLSRRSADHYQAAIGMLQVAMAKHDEKLETPGHYCNCSEHRALRRRVIEAARLLLGVVRRSR